MHTVLSTQSFIISCWYGKVERQIVNDRRPCGTWCFREQACCKKAARPEIYLPSTENIIVPGHTIKHSTDDIISQIIVTHELRACERATLRIKIIHSMHTINLQWILLCIGVIDGIK